MSWCGSADARAVIPKEAATGAKQGRGPPFSFRLHPMTHPSTAASVALTASGLFLLAGMTIGIWKWRQMRRPPHYQANEYVDIAHRASLLYSFACLVMMKLVEFSPYSEPLQLLAVCGPVFFFATAVASYLWHGYHRREQTQFAETNWATTWGMTLLIVGEIGGVALLVWGFVSSRLWVG